MSANSKIKGLPPVKQFPFILVVEDLKPETTVFNLVCSSVEKIYRKSSFFHCKTALSISKLNFIYNLWLRPNKIKFILTD